MPHPSTQSKEVPPERQLWQGGYSAWDMTANWLLAGLASVVLVAAAMEMGKRQPGAFAAPVRGALLLAVLLWVGCGLLWLYRKLYYHYELTSQRLIHRQGLLFRRTFRLELIDIDDVSHAQGPLQRLVGVGEIRIDSSDRSHPSLILPGVANVEQTADLIDQARRDERRSRAMHIETI